MTSTLRTLSLALMGGVILISAVVVMVLGVPERLELPELWALGAVVLLGAMTNVMIPVGVVLVGIAAVIALATILLHAYPSDAVVERYRAKLEREGGTSYLREDLGLPPKLSGAIREL